MGNEQSRSAGGDSLHVVTLTDDIHDGDGPAPVAKVVEEEPPSPEPSVQKQESDGAQASPADACLDMLPSAPRKAENTADAAIVQDLGDYKLEKQVLGEGAFGKVRLAVSSRTGHCVAVKIIKRKKLNERAEVLLLRERMHHEKLRHPNIVRLHTFIMTPNKYYLVMEYCEGGDLLQYLNNSGMLSDELARSLFRGLIEGIHFCHNLGIHHRDLKLENLMLTGADEKTMMIKIADFGLSDLQSMPSNLSVTFCGSPLYAAPELMTTGAAPDGYDAAKSDVWSCGVVLYALLTSTLPFDADDISALVRLVQEGVPNWPVPESRGRLAIALVDRMLVVDPRQRPLAAEVLHDEWLTIGQKKAIKSSMTTPALQQQPLATSESESKAGSGTLRKSGGLVDGGGGARARGATASTRFFKGLMQQVKEEDEAEAAPGWQPPPPPPSALPPPPAQAPAQAPAAAAAAAAAALSAADESASGGENKRQAGKAMTRAELEAIKLAIANGEVADTVEPSNPTPSAPSAAEVVEGTVDEVKRERSVGSQMTKEEWETIKRERQELKKESMGAPPSS